MSEQRHFSKIKPILISKANGIEASPDAHYGPWDSISDYINWLKEITLNDNITPPIGVTICITNQNTKDCFTYYETSNSIGYWKDDYGGVVLSETDGAANRVLLNELLAVGNVKLRKGTYPLSHTVEVTNNGTYMVMVKNVTLDLNGSHIYTTNLRYKGALFLMTGERPVIRNGEISGSFNVPINHPDYTFWEYEKLIALQLHGDALIEGMNLHHCWGYSIGSGAFSLSGIGWKRIEKKYTDMTLITEGYTSNTFEYILTDAQVIPTDKNYPYVCVRGNDTNYILSQREVVYYFYDENNNQIGNEVYEIPNVFIGIPSGAVKVNVKISRYDSDARYAENRSVDDDNYYIFKDFCFIFSTIDIQCLTVKDCCIHNNSSLGMVGMSYGITKVLNCRSYGHGKPWKYAARNTNTTGFIDIEDQASPIFIMDGCVAQDELRLAMVGSYKSTITNCYGNIGINRGWSANISNCVGRVSSGSDNTIINVSNCTFYQTGSCSKNWTGRNNTYIDCVPSSIIKEKDFVIRRLQNSSSASAISVNGIVRGRIYCPQSMSGTVSGIKNIATKRGSDLDFVWAYARLPNTSDASYQSNVSSYGAISVDGDCYGITSNVPFWSNGHTIHESTFTPSASWGVSTAYGNNDSWTGEYVDCTFNLDSGSMFNAINKRLSSNNATLVFRNCVINNANNCLFSVNMTNLSGKTYKIKFINCTIANEVNLFAISPTTFTYEIINDVENTRTIRRFVPGNNVETITEDTDYDARIKALLARIEALEG